MVSYDDAGTHFYEMLTSQRCTDLHGCELDPEKETCYTGIMADPDYFELS